ncbi:hypothetical protein BDV96DRAFT_582900 [Lophiotrema nucula]|uniref:Uncharacterized protein n=1 Tax=Lophiotrema nucula TaxID=690887 RepID=A0A6A5YXD5_9PLEO|nr:hypothetical protein BDV96DRAFT_582900 [Lophiotrema nucula]
MVTVTTRELYTTTSWRSVAPLDVFDILPLRSCDGLSPVTQCLPLTSPGSRPRLSVHCIIVIMSKRHRGEEYRGVAVQATSTPKLQP